MTTSTDRQTFRETVALVAEKARAKLPQAVNGRIESAAQLVVNGDVEPLDDGSIKVGGSDPTRWYHLVGPTCTCTDFAQGKAPAGWCKHRIAAGISKRVQELLPGGVSETDTTPAPQPEQPVQVVADTPLPEAPASVNVRLTIDGREVQLTLRDTDEGRLLQRLAAVLAQYPAPQPPAQSPASQGQGETPQCPTHGALKRSTKGKGWYCPHKTAAGQGCPSKAT